MKDVASSWCALASSRSVACFSKSRFKTLTSCSIAIADRLETKDELRLLVYVYALVSSARHATGLLRCQSLVLVMDRLALRHLERCVRSRLGRDGSWQTVAAGSGASDSAAT